MNIYDFTIANNKEEFVSLKEYAGKVLLIVNTATKCGLTPQYEALEALYQKYKDKGFVILDFPCSQFLNQAPGSDEEIESFCTLKYNTTFPRFKKLEVNGKDESPLYRYLKDTLPEDRESEESKKFEKMVKVFTLKNKKDDIKWNFTKFLIDREGNPVARFSPAIKPEELETEIEKLL